MTVQPDELSRRIKEVGELQKKYNISPEKMKVITDDLKVRRLNEMTAGEYEDFLVAFKNAVS
jgi:hypothetical protein